MHAKQSTPEVWQLVTAPPATVGLPFGQVQTVFEPPVLAAHVCAPVAAVALIV